MTRDMKTLPEWLQKLWETDRGLAREAEKFIYGNEERPVIEHKHTQGEWKFQSDGLRRFEVKQDWKNLLEDYGFEEAEANAKLMASAPKLLQIAESYFDSMKNTHAEGSFIYNIVLKVLNDIGK